MLGNDTISLKKIQIDELVKSADTDKDGEINYNEFINLMRIQHRSNS